MCRASSSFLKSAEVNCEPRSEWNITPWETPLRLTASRSVEMARNRSIRRLTRQAMTFLAYRSGIDADITEPTTHRDIGKIANPDHIGCRLPELLGQQIDAICGVLRAGLRLWRFHGTHFGEIHLFHQPVHSTFTDGYAIFPRKTEFHFAGAQTLVRLGVDLQISGVSAAGFPAPWPRADGGDVL